MLGGVLAGALCGLVIGTLVGAIILRGAIWLYNKMVGGPEALSAVPEPSIGKGMGIMLVTSVVQTIVNFGVGMVMAPPAAAAGQPAQQATPLAALISIPVSLLAMAGMLTALLPTTFGRAFLVTLCYVLIGVVIGVIVGGIALVVMLALR